MKKSFPLLVTTVLCVSSALCFHLFNADDAGAAGQVVIEVTIFPAQAQAVPIKTNWNLECCYQPEHGGRTGIQSKTASNSGKATFVVPVQKDGHYTITCLGGWAYIDGHTVADATRTGA
ncbi:hypothetical protein JW905_09255 [bacterium]|nr:hypothetical protein [candidate division CSSED10-310 bacterium]